MICRKHGEWVGLESCPECDTEAYIQQQVGIRTIYLVEEINRLRKLLKELQNE